MESRNCDRLALSFSVLDTRIFSEQISQPSITRGNPRARIASISRLRDVSCVTVVILDLAPKRAPEIDQPLSYHSLTELLLAAECVDFG
jgi:hypothetical protein